MSNDLIAIAPECREIPVNELLKVFPTKVFSFIMRKTIVCLCSLSQRCEELGL
jgi:hypothetical protein